MENNHKQNLNIVPNKRVKKRYIFLILFMVLLITVTFIVLLKDYDLEELVEYIKNADKKYLLMAMAMPIIFLSLQSLSTQSIQRRLDCKNGFYNNLNYAAVDFYFCSITPCATGGQPLAIYYMSKDDIPISKSTIITLLNTATYKLVLIFLGIIALIFSRNLIFGSKIILPILFFIGLVINSGLCFLCFSGIYAHDIIFKLGCKIINLLHRFKIVKDLERTKANFEFKIKEYAKGGEFIKKNPLVFAEVFGYNLIQRVAFFSVAYFIYRAFGYTEYSFITLLCVQVIISIAVDSLPIPGGIGMSEGLLLVIYNKIYELSFIMPAMILTRFFGFYLCLLISGILIIINQIRLIICRKIIKKETV